jgi:hypothetical protein
MSKLHCCLITFQVLGVFFMNDVGKVTAIVENHVEGLATRECSKGLLNAPGIFLLGFTFPSEDWHTGCSDAVDLVNAIDRIFNHLNTHAAAAWSCVEKMFCSTVQKMRDSTKHQKRIRIVHKMTR